MNDPEYDIVVVGAGIAGAALVRALENTTCRLALVEARDLNAGRNQDDAVGIHAFDTRVSAITPASQAFLEHVGAWSSLPTQRICPYRSMRVWDADGTGEIGFDASELDAPLLGHIVENSRLVDALLAGIDRRPLDILSPARLSAVTLAGEAGTQITLEDGRRLETRLLVAADGALSPVRELAGFRTREWEYGQRALVTTVETERHHGGTAYQRFLTSGPLAFLPLPDRDGRHYCSIVWSANPELADTLLDLSDDTFRDTVAAALEYRLGEVLDCAARTAFPLRQRHAVEYVKPGVALVGDAAHTIHPLAGQGINLGLQDVMALAEELTAGIGRGEDPGDVALLRRYQRRRKGENLLMMAAMDGFRSLFGSRQLGVRWLRNRGLDWVDRAGPLKQQLMRHAMGVR